MNGVLGLLLFLLSAASTYGLESVCDATQDASVCYGDPGGPVMLQLMRNTTGYILGFSNEEGLDVFTIMWGTVVPSSLFPQGRWQVVAGIGTLIINPAEWSDSGTYTVRIYREDPWTLVGEHTVNLMIKGLSESVCDATQDASVCYGALGGPVMLQLMRNTTGYELDFDNEKGDTVFSIIGGTVTPSSLCPQERWQVVAGNRTLIINPAERSDSGTYTVWIYREDPWTLVGEHTVNLLIKAPLSDLDLSISCSANGERRVNCSSNGDSPQFSWSLDGRALSEVFPDALSQTDSRSAVLTLPEVTPEVTRGHQGSSEVTRGHLTCSAVNYFSSINTTQPLPSCTTTPLPMTTPTTTPATTSATTSATTLATTPATTLAITPATTMETSTTSTFATTMATKSSTTLATTLATSHQSGPSDEASVWIFITVALIIVLASLLVGGCYLHMRRKRTHTAGENQEVELSPASMSRSRRRRRGLEEGEEPSGDNRRESVIYEIDP